MSVLTRPAAPPSGVKRTPSRSPQAIALRDAIAPPAPRAADATPDVDSVREAIRGGTTRRTVVRTGVWSVPVVAAAVAAPAFASSNLVCPKCPVAGGPTECTILVNVGDPIPAGKCKCDNGLVCVHVGPLDLANVCLAALPALLNTQCGPNTCYGICLEATGTVVNAVNALVGTLTVSITALSVLPGCDASITGNIPGNICVVPVTDVTAGTFGALCITNTGTGGIFGTANTAIATLKAAVSGLGIGGLAFANACAGPYSCQPGVRAQAQPNTNNGCKLPGVPNQSLDLTVGFCKC